jgi:hypothetical protein
MIQNLLNRFTRLKNLLINLKKYLVLFGEYLLYPIGAIAVSWYIWARFIRERLPKDIPFIELSEIGLYIIIYICCIYLYIVITLIKPRDPHPIIIKAIDILMKPLTALDAAIKSIPKVDSLHRKLLDYIIPILVDLSLNQMKVIYVCMYIIPRVILVVTLGLDTFWFNKLENIYNIVLLAAIPLLHRYLKYSLKAAKEQLIQELEDDYDWVEVTDKAKHDFYKYIDDLDRDDVPMAYREWKPNPKAIYAEKIVKVKKYLEIKYESLDSEIKYVGDPILSDKKEYAYAKAKYGDENAKLSLDDYKFLKKELQEKIIEIIYFYLFLNYYSEAIDDVLIKWSKIIIFSVYSICWLYIIYKSYEKVEEFPILEGMLKYIYIIVDIEEPFSLLVIEYSPMEMNLYLKVFIVIVIIILAIISFFYIIKLIIRKVKDDYEELKDDYEELKEKYEELKEIYKESIKKCLEIISNKIKKHTSINHDTKKIE